jgi:hypothetical protein
MERKTLYFLVVPLVVTLFVGAFSIGGGMNEFYCSIGSTFLWLDLSGWGPYCAPFVFLVHVVLGSLVVILVISKFFPDPKKNADLDYQKKPDLNISKKNEFTARNVENAFNFPNNTGPVFLNITKDEGRIDDFHPNLVVVGEIKKALLVTEFHHKTDPSKNRFGGTAIVKQTYLPPIREADGSTDNYTEITESYLYGGIIVENRKIGNKTISAKNVHCKMSFFHSDGTPFRVGVLARWADKIEISTMPSIAMKENHYSLETDVPAGAQRELCCIVKHVFDDSCYIFNLETYNKQVLKLPESKLGKGEMLIKVELRGENTPDDVISWFQLINPGAGDEFSLKLTGSPDN